MIKAIETRYKGFRFRSRIEARWAVFFDAVGLEWQYEAQGYELPGDVAYLPDFWLPHFQMFVEVKGAGPNSVEIEKYRRLRDGSGYAVLLVVGLPYEKPSTLFCWDAGDSSGGRSEWDATFLFHKIRPGVILHGYGNKRGTPERDLFLNDEFGGMVDFLVYAPFRQFKFKGTDAARGARFEHGDRA